MKVTKVFSTTGSTGSGNLPSDGSQLAVGGNHKSRWVDMQNTRDDKALVVFSWSNKNQGAANGSFKIRVQGLMESNTDDPHDPDGKVTLVALQLPNTSLTGTLLRTQDLDGPFTYNIQVVDTDETRFMAYIPKLPRMLLQVFAVTNEEVDIDAWFVA